MSRADAPDSGGPGADAAVLDNPGLASLTGSDARLALRRGRVLRYAGEVCPFVGMPATAGPDDWRDLAGLAGPGRVVALAALELRPPDGWETVFRLEGVQMTGERVAGAPDPEAVPLGPADVPEMMRLVELTRPGPFLPDTVRLGGYLGIRRGGALVAMAGERLHPPGWAEVSAVCTDPAHRGQGLAGRLIRAVAAGVQRRGQRPFLHAAAENTGAVRLYESLGFRVRRSVLFTAARVPGTMPAVSRPGRGEAGRQVPAAH